MSHPCHVSLSLEKKPQGGFAFHAKAQDFPTSGTFPATAGKVRIGKKNTKWFSQITLGEGAFIELLFWGCGPVRVYDIASFADLIREGLEEGRSGRLADLTPEQAAAIAAALPAVQKEHEERMAVMYGPEGYNHFGGLNEDE